MPRSDSGSPDALRADLKHFAELVLRLEEEGRLLETTPQLLKLLGDLRAKLFAYEVRCTPRPAAATETVLSDAERIVREAIERAREAEREWGHGWNAGED